MEENKKLVTEGSLTKSYTKEFTWEIENFVDWWSNRPIEESNRNNDTPWEEDMCNEEPNNWEKASGSPVFKFEINGIEHEFRIDILKYDSWDRHDDDHNLMMGISLFYNGPWESIPVKTMFWLRNTGRYASNKPIETADLKNGEHSYARVFSDYSIGNNINQLLDPHFQVNCSIQVDIPQGNIATTSFGIFDSERKTFGRCIDKNFDFISNEGFFKQTSDFEIFCVDQGNNGESSEVTLHCHKIVLYLGSEYYRKMLSNNFVESKGKVVVTDTASTTMIKVLQYLYTGDIDKSLIDVDLLYASEKYDVEHLPELCESVLAENLNIENVFDIVLAANDCGSKNFQEYVYSFLGKHWKKIREDKRSQIFLSKPEVLMQILNQMP